MSRFFSGPGTTLPQCQDVPTDALVQEMAARYRAGDLDARRWYFEQLDRLGRPLARRRMRGNPAVAAMEETGDILQNVLAKLLKQWDRHPARLPESLDGLRLALRGATRDILIEASRKHLGPQGWLRNLRQKEHAELDLRADHATASSRVHRVEAEAIVNEALDKLAEPHRQAVLFHVLDGLTYEQIAIRLGVHEKTVGNWCRTTLKRLDERFRNAGLV